MEVQHNPWVDKPLKLDARLVRIDGLIEIIRSFRAVGYQHPAFDEPIYFNRNLVDEFSETHVIIPAWYAMELGFEVDKGAKSDQFLLDITSVIDSNNITVGTDE